MELQIIPSLEIDKQRWDDCIANSTTPLIYAKSFYLNFLADNWSAIIADDYEFVMPVPWRKKYGIKYCYHVPFIQQLGVFGQNLNEDILITFQKKLNEFVSYGDYAFNYSNVISAAVARNNYILPLSSKYEITREFFSSSHLGNISKAEKNSLQYLPGEVDEAIDLFKSLYAKRLKNLNETAYKNFSELCNHLNKENNVIVRKVVSNNETLSCALLLKDERRLYNLMPSTTEKGKQFSAGHFLFDCLIKEFSHTGMILDFEGSDIPGIESFYKSFGAVNQQYYQTHINSLPFLLRFFKR